MAEWWKKLRWRIAYLIASDWIDDLEYRFSVFLCDQTGGMLSKCYYSVETMRMYANDYTERRCQECEEERREENG